MKRMKKEVGHVASGHDRVEPDLVFWLEHIVHWYLFLIAMVAVLVIGITMYKS